MPMLITPKDPVQSKAFHISDEAPKDLWDCAALCESLRLTLNMRWYGDPSPSVPDGRLGTFTIRPTDGKATDANTLSGGEGDWVTWDGINLAVKTDAQVQSAYDLQDAPAPDPAPEPTPPDPQPEPDPVPEPEPNPSTGDEPQGNSQP